MKVSHEEALYYLSSNDFDLSAALREYQDDIRWEQERRAHVQRSSLFKKLGFLSVFLRCFPFYSEDKSDVKKLVD